MLASSQSGAFICLRCQSRSLRRLLPRNSNAPSDSPSPYNSLRRFSQRSNLQDGIKAYPFGRLRGKKGGKVRESSEVLPVKTLGKPAEIIILKDAHIGGEKQEEIPDISIPEAPVKSSKGAILKSIREGGGLVDEEAVHKSLDDLRDKAMQKSIVNGKLSQEELDEHIRSLLESFTNRQLITYISKSHQRATGKTFDRPVYYSSWQPGITPITKRKKLVHHGSSFRLQASKKQVASYVIIECWGLCLTDQTGIGEIDVASPSILLSARNEHGVSVLDEIAQRRGVKIEVYGETILRLTADKSSAMDALTDIQSWNLGNCSEEIPLLEGSKLSIAARSPLQAKDCIALSALTGVQLTKNVAKTQKPHISIAGHNAEQVNDAYRALYAISELQNCSKHEFQGVIAPALYSKRYEQHGKNIAQVVSSQAGLSYRDRNETWLRYTTKNSPRTRQDTPKERATGDLPSPVPILDKIRSKTETYLLKNVKLGKNAPTSKKGISTKPYGPATTTLSTRVGHVYIAGDKHLFLPCVPYPAAVLPYLSADSPPSQSEATRTVVGFTFRHDPETPSPADGTTAVPILPEITFEFELAVSPSGVKTTSLVGGFAVTEDRNYSIAVYDRAVDLCINKTATKKLNLDILAADSEILSAVEQMTNSILGEGRLRAPRTVMFSRPPSLMDVSRSTRVQSDKSVIGDATTPTSNIRPAEEKVRYRFVGVQHKQTIAFKYEGLQAFYTSVEGGSLGRSYSEFKVVEADFTNNTQKGAKAFWKAILDRGARLVDIFERAAQGQLEFKEQSEGKVLASGSSPRIESSGEATLELEAAQDGDKKQHMNQEVEERAQRRFAAHA